MSADFSNTENISFEDGELVDAADMLTEAQASRNRSQEIIASILGTLNAIPAIDPLQVEANGTFTLIVGGAGQRALVQGSWCDDIPAIQLQCPGSTNVDRTDSIAVKALPLNADGNTISREVIATDGSKATQNIPLVVNSMAAVYVEGSEAPPAGYVEFARVLVPANSVGLVPGNITILFPDPRKCITGTDSSPVTSLSGQGGDITLVGEGNINVDSSTAGEVKIIGTPTTINGDSGAITLEGDGQITLTTPAPNTIKINAPAAVTQTSVNGKTGAVTLKGTGIASVSINGQNGQEIDINVPAQPGATTINGDQPGPYTLEDGNGVHVRKVAAQKYAFDNTGVTHFNGHSGDVGLDFSSDFSVTDGETTQVALANQIPRAVPYRMTFLQGGGYAKPGNGVDMGVTLSPNGGFTLGADTIDTATFSIGYQTVLTVNTAFTATFFGLGVGTTNVYVNGALAGSCGGKTGSIAVNIPVGTVTIDLVYNATQMGQYYYLGQGNGGDVWGGSFTLFGWVPINGSNVLTDAITSLAPGAYVAPSGGSGGTGGVQPPQGGTGSGGGVRLN